MADGKTEKAEDANGDDDAVTLINKGFRAMDAKKNGTPEAEATPAVDVAAKDAAQEAGDNVVDSDKANDAKPGEDLAALKKRISEMEAREKGRTLTLDGEYAKAKFIASGTAGIPIPLLERWLPATTDQTKLSKSINELGEYLRQFARQNPPKAAFGGASRDGGHPPGTLTTSTADIPAGQLIAEGLLSRRRQF